MNTNKPVSKVLVLDGSADHAHALRRFCDENNLIFVPVSRDGLASALATHIDLGAVLLAENYGGSPAESAAVAAELDASHPDVPIILRRDSQPTLDDLAPAWRDTLCGAWVGNDFDALRAALATHVFSLDYPNSLLQGIADITAARIASVFGGLEVTSGAPHIVRDRIIFGEVFSLIPLESAWCRGYMMMQAEEEALVELAGLGRNRRTHDASFRELNSRLGELTNLVWGAFKNRYPGGAQAYRSETQVPLLINHRHRYISFGSENPQLCFRYTLRDDATGRTAQLDQRFAFSLAWSPEDFTEVTGDEAPVDSGEIDLF